LRQVTGGDVVFAGEITGDFLVFDEACDQA
jgi:hypothetical protein